MRAHHGSLSREQRLVIESDLKAGRLRAIVATSSLELGIDMGSVDLVVLVESPGSVAARHAARRPRRPPGRRAEHRQDLPEVPRRPARSRGRRAAHARRPRRGDALPAQSDRRARAADRRRGRGRRVGRRRRSTRSMRRVRQLRRALRRRVPRVARHARGPLSRRTASRGLRPRVVWDRVQDRVRAREGAQRVAIASGGTIPDRGLFGVFLPDGVRVGELDEEMVYESRVGRVASCSARSTWRIEEITFDRVVVTPAPGEPGEDAVLAGRPARAGRSSSAARSARMVARAARARPARRPRPRCARDGLDAHAADEPARATSTSRASRPARSPTTARSSIERFPDEIGDWRVCILTPFGSRVHAPWALALEERLARADMPVQVLWTRRRHHPAAARSDRRHPARAAARSIPTRSRSSSSSGCRARRCSRRASARTRPARCCSRAAGPASARRCGSSANARPICSRSRPATRRSRCCSRRRASACATCSTSPRCARCSADIRSRKVRVVPVETKRASPFAQSLLFGWIAVYMYEGDAPLAERRAAALALDRDLLRDLLGAEELRELLDPEVLAELELELQRLVAEPPGASTPTTSTTCSPTSARSTVDELRARSALPIPEPWLDELLPQRRVIASGEPLRGGRGRGAPARRARRRAPARAPDRVHRSGRPARSTISSRATRARTARSRSTRSPAGSASRPSASATRSARSKPTGGSCTASSGPAASSASGATRACCACCAAGRSRRCATRSSRSTRATFARFLPAWQGVGRGRRGLDALVETLEQLQGVAIPASVLERDVLPARVEGYRAEHARRAVRGGRDRVGRRRAARRRRRPRALYFRDRVRLLAPAPVDRRPARRRRSTTRSAPGSRPRARRSGPTSSPRARHRRRVGGADRALGSRVGGRGHQRHVRSAARAAPRDAKRAPRAGGRNLARLTRLGSAGGRGPLVARRAAARTGAQRRPRSRTRRRCNCSSATAS